MARQQAAAKADKAAAKADKQEPAPPFWIADRPLPVGDEMGAETMPVVAFQTGDRVPPGHVQQYGWQPYVHAPDGDWPPPEPAPLLPDAAADDTGNAGSGE